jgi:hypothetical protein
MILFNFSIAQVLPAFQMEVLILIFLSSPGSNDIDDFSSVDSLNLFPSLRVS